MIYLSSLGGWKTVSHLSSGKTGLLGWAECMTLHVSWKTKPSTLVNCILNNDGRVSSKSSRCFSKKWSATWSNELLFQITRSYWEWRSVVSLLSKRSKMQICITNGNNKMIIILPLDEAQDSYFEYPSYRSLNQVCGWVVNVITNPLTTEMRTL